MGTLALFAASFVPAWYVVSALAGDSPRAPGARAAAAPAGATAAAAPKLFTVPEDGAPSDDVPASSRLVRDLVAAHPGEDLVICIAGCRPGDRVIYAQPADPMAKKPVVAQAQPQPATGAEPAKAEATVASPQTAPAEPADAAKTEQPNETPAAEAPAGESESETKMEPTSAEPEAAKGDGKGPDGEDKSDGVSSDDGDKPGAEEPSEKPSNDSGE
jgi:hypothetical protein